MSARKHRVIIYHSRAHLFFTFLLIVLPLLFLVVVAEVSQIAVLKLYTDIILSLWRLGVSYLIAVSLGWLCAVLFYRGKQAIIALPIFDVLQSFPTFAALPLATYLWGKSSLTVIIFLVTAIIWPVFFSVVSSLRLMKHEWEEAVEIMGLKGFAYIRYFLLPVSIPGVITGSIIGLGDAWEALVATEIIVGTRGGLGPFFASYSKNGTVTMMGVLGLLLIIFSINKLLWMPLLEWTHQKMEE